MTKYNWKLSDLKVIKKNNKNVFSCFACGGGSSMGYKLAGYDIIGINEIDKDLVDIYKKNLETKLVYQEDIRELINKDLPKELYNLDILDGSPPCSTFSMAGSREKYWDKEKKFKEGQVNQDLSELFVVYIKLIEKLKPKVIIGENVKGIIQGNAKGYTKLIISKLKGLGYNVQIFLLNSASMGVPQNRQRVFFIGIDKKYKLGKLKLDFNEKPILYKEVEKTLKEKIGKEISKAYYKWWVLTPPGRSLSYNHPKGSFFNSCKINKNNVLSTITACGGAKLIHYKYPNEISDEALMKCGSFPTDYNFMGYNAKYIIGMSVPPLMIQKISSEIYKQWLSKI